MTALADPSLAVFKQVVAVLGRLSEGQLRDLADGRGQLVFQSGDTVVGARGRRSTASKPTAGARQKLDAEAAVAAIRGMTAREEIAAYLDTNDRALTGDLLREIAQLLGPTVAKSSKATKAVLKRNIVEGTAGFRERSTAMSGGVWS